VDEADAMAEAILANFEAGLGSPVGDDTSHRPALFPTTRTTICDMLLCMPQVDRLSVTMPPGVGSAVREAAAHEGISVSSWVTEAAARRLRNELLGAALDEWEAKNGDITEEELDRAATSLGIARRRRREKKR